MQISPVQNINNFNYKRQLVQPNFTGGTSTAANVAGEAVARSRLFDPLKNAYDKYLVSWLAENYFAKLSTSKIAAKFIEKTAQMGDMTKHMSAVGATLISGMYITRTLNNDKLDPQKRKTLAINDALTWALSTAGSYALDKKLDKWADDVRARFAANYLMNNPINPIEDEAGKIIGQVDSRNTKLLGEWKFENINLVVKDSTETAIRKYEQMKSTLSPEEFKKWLKEINMKEKHFEYLKKEPIKDILDFNTHLLKNKNLDTMMRGIGVLKTLFVFGMVYRYLVPVLVMKPANMIGNYIHNKKAAKEVQAS